MLIARPVPLSGRLGGPEAPRHFIQEVRELLEALDLLLIFLEPGRKPSTKFLKCLYFPQFLPLFLVIFELFRELRSLFSSSGIYLGSGLGFCIYSWTPGGQKVFMYLVMVPF